jgi:hypothetical protein
MLSQIKPNQSQNQSPQKKGLGAWLKKGAGVLLVQSSRVQKFKPQHHQKNNKQTNKKLVFSKSWGLLVLILIFH